MKKIFSLFTVALIGLGASAQDCPTESKMSLLNGDDAANVEIELSLNKNASPYLEGFFFRVSKPEGATWKKAYGENYFTGQGYAPYILGNLASGLGEDLTDEELEEYLYEACDILGLIRGDNLDIIEILYWHDCRFFPACPGKVGKFAIDMSALEDGEYELRSENTPNGSNLYYVEEQSTCWLLDEPMVITLLKQGNTVFEKRSTPAFYVSSLSAISTIATDDVDSRIFDLQGRELQSAPEHGIYIQNGKKYVK